MPIRIGTEPTFARTHRVRTIQVMHCPMHESVRVYVGLYLSTITPVRKLASMRVTPVAKRARLAFSGEPVRNSMIRGTLI